MKSRMFLVVTLFTVSFTGLNAVNWVHAEQKSLVVQDTSQDAPKNLKETWSQIRRNQEALHKTITARKLEPEVENIAGEISRLARLLPDQSRNLDAQSLQGLDKAIKDINQLAADLDNTSDQNNQAGTEANARKLDEVLNAIAALYPKGALPEKPKAPAVTVGGGANKN